MNPRLVKINEVHTSMPSIPRNEAYDDYSLLEATRNYAMNMLTCWKKGLVFSEFEAKHFRNHYQELREALMSLDVDIHEIPRRIRVRVEKATVEAMVT